MRFIQSIRNIIVRNAFVKPPRSGMKSSVWKRWKRSEPSRSASGPARNYTMLFSAPPPPMTNLSSAKAIRKMKMKNSKNKFTRTYIFDPDEFSQDSLRIET